jgi:hypothetical protein
VKLSQKASSLKLQSAWAENAELYRYPRPGATCAGQFLLLRGREVGLIDRANHQGGPSSQKADFGKRRGRQVNQSRHAIASALSFLGSFRRSGRRTDRADGVTTFVGGTKPLAKTFRVASLIGSGNGPVRTSRSNDREACHEFLQSFVVHDFEDKYSVTTNRCTTLHL